MGRAEKEIGNNHLQIKRALYKLPGAEKGDSFPLGQPLLTAPGLKPYGTVLDVFSPDSGVRVATTVPKWDTVQGSVCRKAFLGRTCEGKLA